MCVCTCVHARARVIVRVCVRICTYSYLSYSMTYELCGRLLCGHVETKHNCFPTNLKSPGNRTHQVIRGRIQVYHPAEFISVTVVLQNGIHIALQTSLTSAVDDKWKFTLHNK